MAYNRMMSLRVTIDARVRPGAQGGVQQAIIGLAAGLSGLEGSERYQFLVDGDGGWLQPFMGGLCEVVPATFPSQRQRQMIAACDRRLDGTGAAARYLLETRGRRLPGPDPAASRFDADVVHFMRHRGWRTTKPNLYVPHDLQQVDLPDLFSPQTRLYRRWVYTAMAAQATKVVALSDHQIDQFSTYFNRLRQDVVVVPWASVLPLYDQSKTDVSTPLPAQVPERFGFYPAAIWSHKNHVVLVEALARLRKSGVDVPVVLTGGGDWTPIRVQAERAGVGDLVVHLGYVEPPVIRSLYSRAELLVFPSTYEGFGLPVVEAMSAGVPVVCSDIPPLDRLTNGCAQLFHPHDSADLADALASVWCSAERRATLATRAKANTSGLTWHRTALRYRALYRQLAGRDTPEDKNILAEVLTV